MDTVSRKSCRLCLSETEFNVSLFGNYCRRTNMADKILVCLKLVIEENDYLNTVCYKCAENIERYYEFVLSIKKCQVRYTKDNFERPREASQVNRRHITSYVREQVYDADYTFSFLDLPNEEKKEPNQLSSPFFSYFSPPNMVKPSHEPIWKTPKDSKKDKYKPYKHEKTRHHSRDLFESQSQDVDDNGAKSLDWKLTPDENILKRVRQKCFGEF
jgi:hypothetical protein